MVELFRGSLRVLQIAEGELREKKEDDSFKVASKNCASSLADNNRHIAGKDTALNRFHNCNFSTA